MLSFGMIYSLFCCGICAISIFLNGLLVCIVRQRRAGIGFYRFFTLSSVMVGVLYSTSYAAVQPFWYADIGVAGTFSVAPWNENIKLIRVAYQFWFVSFVSVLLCMACSFLYRYGLLCSPKVVACFETPRRLAGIFFFILAICVWWVFNANYLLFQESLKTRKIMQNKFSAEYGVDFLSSYVIIVDINDESAAKNSIFATFAIIVVMQILIGIMFRCGFRIHQTVKVRTMSVRMKRIHKNALKMMICQALNPALFIYTPSTINMLGVFFEIDYGHLPKVLAILCSLFPIFNPLIVIYFTKEYKNFIFPQRSSTVQMLVSFGTIYSVFCCGTCVISFLLNGLLVYIIRQRRAGIGFYRFFTIATVLIGVSYSLALATVQPIWYAGPGMLGTFSVAPWNGNIKVIRFAYQFWFTSYVLVLLCMTCSFLYRYGLLCSPRIVHWFETPRRLVVILTLLLAFCGWWLYDSNYFLFHDSRKIRTIMHYKLSAEYGVNLLSSYLLTIDVNDPIVAKDSIMGSLSIIAMMQVQLVIMFRCGFLISKTVRIRRMSDRMKRIHKNALKMMICQALNPAVFLYTAPTVNMLGMFIEVDYGHFPQIVSMLCAWFPIVNPLIVIYFTEEYRNFIFHQPSTSIQFTSSVTMSSTGMNKY